MREIEVEAVEHAVAAKRLLQPAHADLRHRRGAHGTGARGPRAHRENNAWVIP